MELEINGKKVKLNFGVGFIRKMDKKYFVTQQGIKLGTAVQYIFMKLAMKDAVVLSELITEASSVGQSEADAFIDEQEDLEPLFDAFFEQFKTQPATKPQWEVLEQQLEAQGL